jgi:hypothetical protein
MERRATVQMEMLGFPTDQQNIVLELEFFFPNGHRLSQVSPVRYISSKTSATARENLRNGNSIHCFQQD